MDVDAARETWSELHPVGVDHPGSIAPGVLEVFEIALSADGVRAGRTKMPAAWPTRPASVEITGGLS